MSTHLDVHTWTDVAQLILAQLVPDGNSASPEALVPVLSSIIPYPIGYFDLQFGADEQFLAHPIRIYHTLDEDNESRKDNRALLTLTASPTTSPRPWPGSVVALKMADLSGQRFLDFSSVDVKHVQAYFSMV